MKTGRLLTAVPFMPLVAVFILALVGVIFNLWVYLILAIVCPAVAGLIWFMYKDTERKMKDYDHK